MNSNFTIKNFRAFNNVGADIEIRPITILTGCNSSGKSSFVKALLLLNELFRKNDSDNVLKNSKLDFTSETLSMLGDFSTIHNEEASHLGNNIEISYDVVSSILLGSYNVTLSFGPTQNDRLNNGCLKDVAVKDSEGNVIWGIRHNKNDKGISVLKSRFFALYSVIYVLHNLNSVYCENNILGTKTDEDLRNFIDSEMMPVLKSISDKFGRDIVYDAIDYYVQHLASMSDASKWTRMHIECFDDALEHDILTYLPMISVISEISKENFAKEIMQMYESKELSYITKEDVQRIIDAFLSSEASTFVEFYRQLENDHIDDTYNPVDPPMTRSLDFLRKDHQSLFSASDMSLSTPHFYDSVETVDLSGEDTSKSDTEPTSSANNPSLFELTYFFMVQLSKVNASEEEFRRYVNNRGEDFFDRQYQSYVYDKFNEFIKDGLIDVLSYNVCENIRYVGSSRINIKRLYTLDDKDDFTRTLAEYFESIRVFKTHYKLEYEPDSFMNSWLRKFGIGYKIAINPIGPGLGTMPIIYKDANDQKGRALADYGYGISQLISVLIEIETAILKAKVVGVKNVINREQSKFNVSEIFNCPKVFKYENQTIAIEEPEIHLHPKYQSLLADMFLEAYTNYGINFIIETHSEYLVRKLQTMVARKQIDKNLISLTYVESDNTSNKKARRILIKDDGCLTEPFGEGFYDEADNLAMSLLMIKGGLA